MANLQTVVVNLAEALELTPELINDCLTIKVGDSVFAGEIIAQKKKIFGLKIRKVKSPVTGLVAEFNKFDGKLSIQTEDHIDDQTQVINSDTISHTVNVKELKIDKDAVGNSGEDKHFVRPSTKNCIPTDLVINHCQGEGHFLGDTFSDDTFDAKLSGKIILTSTPLSLKQMYRASAVGIVGVVLQGSDYLDLATGIKDQVDNKIQLAFCLISKGISLKKLHNKNLFIDDEAGQLCQQ